MIEINLLPISYYKQKKRKKIILFISIFGIVFILLLVFIYFSNLTKLTNLDKEIAIIKHKQEKFIEILNEIDKLQKEKEEFEKREKVVKSILDIQKQWPNFLSSLFRITPSTIWFTSISSTTAGEKKNFVIDGIAVSKDAVSEFEKNISKLPNVENLLTRKIIDKGPGAIGQFEFQITFTIKL